MISSNAFDYMNVLNKAASASWEREQLISNNIANADTPGYKRRDLDFESTLESELGKSKYVSLDDKVANIHMDHLNEKTYIDNASYSYRLDGNNVDPEQENVELASETIRYLGLTNSISQEISRYKTVIK